MHLSIRKAVPADAEALSELYLHHLTETPPGPPQDLRLWREKLARFAGDPRYHLLVGEADGAVTPQEGGGEELKQSSNASAPDALSGRTMAAHQFPRRTTRPAAIIAASAGM